MRQLFRGVLAAVAVTLILGASPTSAHTTFKKELGKKYPNMKISCNACHVKKEPKTKRGEFGKLFEKEFKGKEITANFKSRKGAEKKKYENEVMIPAFKEALKKIKEKKNKDGEKYDDLIKAGQIPEITKKDENTGG